MSIFVFLGALCTSGVVTLLFGFLFRGLTDTLAAIVLANVVSLIIATTVASYGFSTDDQPDVALALSICAPPQLIWLLAHVARWQRCVAAAEADDHGASPHS